MYKGCESAMGLLINLKVSDDEKEFTDLLKKKPFPLPWCPVWRAVHPRVGRVVRPIVVVGGVGRPGGGVAGGVVLRARVVLAAVVILLPRVVLSVVMLRGWGRSSRCWTAWNTGTTIRPEMWLSSESFSL